MPYREPARPEPSRRLPLLEQVAIKSPCSQSWAEMEGDDRSRLCLRCSKTVYDLSAMDSEEAELFLERHIGGDSAACVRLYRRPDGRVLTSECGPAAGARHRRRATAVLATTAAALLSSGIVGASMTTLGPDLPNDEPTTAETLTMALPYTNQPMRVDHAYAMEVLGELDTSQRIASLPEPPEWDVDPENEHEGTAARTERKRASAQAPDALVAPVPVRLVSARSIY